MSDYPAGPYGGVPDRANEADAYMSILDNHAMDKVAQRGPARPSDLDSGPMRDIWRRLFGHYRRELDIQGPWRREMALDEAFYDHDQWSADERQVLQERGQEPLVFNVIKTSIDWIIGTERRSRADYKVIARRKEGTGSAERKSQLLKYLSDANRTEFSFSDAFDEAVVAGLSFLECGLSGEDGKEPIYDRGDSWRNVIFDSMATERDLQDGRYYFRHRWTDFDTAARIFPERRGVLIEAARGTHLDLGPGLDGHGDEAMDAREELLQYPADLDDSIGSVSRSRIRLIEAWFRMPVETERLVGGDFNGEVFDPYSAGHHEDLERGRSVLRQGIGWRTFVALMSSAGLLSIEPSPYRHNRYPFTPVWCYRKRNGGAPYGVVRGMRDAQRDINKRHSKALAILSSNKVIMDRGAVENLDEFEEEVARPDAIIVKEKGYELNIDADRELAASHMTLMQASMALIQSLSGVTDENLGRKTNATSGKAIIARQEQGSLATAKIFDNLRYARQVHGEKMLSLTEQFMSDERQFRITNARGNPEYITVNDGDPNNDIVRYKADFIITEDSWNASVRQSMVEELLALMQQLAPTAPQIVLVLLDLLVEAMDVPSREEIVKRIRQVTGMEDPSADPEAPDPERAAREAAKAAQAAMEQRAAEANIAKIEGEAAEKAARAAEIAARTERLRGDLTADDIARQRAAFDLAAQIMQGIGAVDVADQILAAAEQRTGTSPSSLGAPLEAQPDIPPPGPAAPTPPQPQGQMPAPL